MSEITALSFAVLKISVMVLLLQFSSRFFDLDELFWKHVAYSTAESRNDPSRYLSRVC